MGTNSFRELCHQWARRNWPTPYPDNKNVAIIFVSYNTLDLTAGLLYSLFRVLGRDKVSRILAVDNNSTDGSQALLTHFAENGMLDLLANRTQHYHGPAINQAIAHLATMQRRVPEKEQIRYIWVIDSDVILLRSDVIDNAVNFLEQQGAAAVGQFQYDALPEGYAHISSLLIDPAKVWQRRVIPFDNSGAPAANLQTSLRRHGFVVGDFPYRSQQYLLHLARGTLKSIHAQGDRKNSFYQWAATHSVHHYHGNPHGEAIHHAFLEIFRREVPTLTAEALLSACRQSSRIEIPPAKSIR